MATKIFINGGTGFLNWNVAANWSPVASVPGNGDDVILNADSPNCAINTNTAAINSFDASAYTNVLSSSSTLQVRGTSSATNNIIFGSGMTQNWTGLLSITTTGTNKILNLTTNGKTIRAITVNAAGTSLVFQGAVNCSTSTITLSSGTLNTGGYSVSCGILNISGSTTRSFIGTGSVITLVSTGNVFNAGTTTNLSFSNATSYEITDTSATSKTFIGGGLSYSEVIFTGDNIRITGNNTFTTLNLNNAGTTNGTLFTAFTKQTIGSFVGNGSANNLTKLSSITAGSPFIFIGNSSDITESYLSIKDCWVQ